MILDWTLAPSSCFSATVWHCLGNRKFLEGSPIKRHRWQQQWSQQSPAVPLGMMQDALLLVLTFFSNTTNRNPPRDPLACHSSPPPAYRPLTRFVINRILWVQSCCKNSLRRYGDRLHLSGALGAFWCSLSSVTTRPFILLLTLVTDFCLWRVYLLKWG